MKFLTRNKNATSDQTTETQPKKKGLSGIIVALILIGVAAVAGAVIGVIVLSSGSDTEQQIQESSIAGNIAYSPQCSGNVSFTTIGAIRDSAGTSSLRFTLPPGATGNTALGVERVIGVTFNATTATPPTPAALPGGGIDITSGINGATARDVGSFTAPVTETRLRVDLNGNGRLDTYRIWGFATSGLAVEDGRNTDTDWDSGTVPIGANNLPVAIIPEELWAPHNVNDDLVVDRANRCWGFA